ncbi:hypothetical protein CRYUN_Cryun33cG0056900 [Craigia yunnanensis]
MPQRDVISWNAILSAYAKSGSSENLRTVFDQMPFRDSVSYNTVIAGLAGSGFSNKALEVFVRMNGEGFEPTEYTHVSVLNACSRLFDLREGKGIHGRILVGDLGRNVFVWNALTDMYAKGGKIDRARWLFDRMSNKNVVSWNSLISGYLKKGQPEKCIDLFQEMQIGALKPAEVTVSNVLGAYFQSGLIHEANKVFSMIKNKDKVVHGKAILLGVDDDLLVSSALVDMGYTHNGQDLEALALYEKMLQENFKPDSITFVAVLSACNHAGLIEEGRRYFDSISKQLTLIPNLDHHACMINLLGRSGPYIMLSNMYATCGRWEDMASVRSLMKSKNVKKFAAYSWIEIDNDVYKFVAEDRTLPETEIIYEELGKLIKKLQEADFMPDTKLVLHDVVQEEKFASICYHSEKLALAFGLMKKPHATTPIGIMNNIRVCGDCHVFIKFVSKIIGRPIILRDSNRFHHFIGGSCSCKDYW